MYSSRHAPAPASARNLRVAVARAAVARRAAPGHARGRAGRPSGTASPRGGFDLLFLMGVWRRSAIGREIARTDAGLVAEYDRVLPGWTPADVPGSPYCIQAYEPDDRMGGWTGLDAARRELRARGIGLILDFVPNHTAFDHPWITTHPDRYVLGTEDDYRAAPSDFRRGRGRRRRVCRVRTRSVLLPVDRRRAIELLQPRDAGSHAGHAARRSRRIATASGATWRC